MTSLRSLLLLLRIPIALLGVVLFFILYNRFLLDTNLQNLKTSLSILNTATDVGHAEAALLLVNKTLVAEMAKEEIDLKTLANLQYAQGALSSDQRQRRVEDAQTMVSVSTQEQVASRPAFLTTLDGVVTGVQAAFRQVTLLPRQVAGGPASQEINMAQLQKAIRLERLGQLAQAAQGYEGLLATYPNYVGRPLLKLRLGYVYERTQDFDRAGRLYQEALRETRDPKEAEVARQMLEGLLQAKRKGLTAKALEQRLTTLGAGSERQQVAFELGSLLIQLHQLEKAAKTFREGVSAAPEGKLALPCLFKEAWALRTLGRFEEALSRFEEIVRRDPKSSWAVASQSQIAEAYKAMGNYEAAAKTYEQALAKAPDKVTQATLRLQTGWTYLNDLHNKQKAEAYLRRWLTPAYPLRPMESKSKETPPPAPPAPVSITLSLQPDTPIVAWLEKFLPIFSEVFDERLAKYMKSANLTNLTRKFTQEEFRELVVRRVQQQFPGQLSDVSTKIKAEGFVGSGMARIESYTFYVEARVGIRVVNERPYTVVQEIKVAAPNNPIGSLVASEDLRKLLEKRVNEKVEHQTSALKIKRYELYDGYALISVEMKREEGAPGEKEGAPALTPTRTE